MLFVRMPPVYGKSNGTQPIRKEIVIQKPSNISSQIEVFENHDEIHKSYMVVFDSNHPGATLIAYNSPTCQANTHGTTIVNRQDSSKFEFTSTDDPYCKITMQITKKHQLKILKESVPCSTWHGDFCSFTTLPILNRLYPLSIDEKKHS